MQPVVPLTEELRQKYRPERIQALFVGESPPAGGDFFYAGTGNLFRSTEEAFRRVYGILIGDDFRRTFQATGCFLDDLCVEPVNHMPLSERRRARERGVVPLSGRMASLQPRVIVPVKIDVEPHVKRAAEAAGLSDRLRPAIPFPAMGNKPRFVAELSRLIAELRDASILPHELSPDGINIEEKETESGRGQARNVGRILWFTSGPEDWKKLLASEKHWRTGYSAKTLAYCWEKADGFPPEVATALETADEPALRDLTPVLAIPEFKVPLPGGVRSSQNDLFVLAHAARGPSA